MRAIEALQLRRQLDWKDAFWASSGVPAGVLLTMGGIATMIGQPSWVIWIASILMGFIQSFVYAEIAGLYPNKSGGASVYGAAAWLPYGKFIAPVSVWCNWLAWSPVLALGTSLGAGYVMASLFPAESAIRQWQFDLVALDFVREGLHLRINLVSIIATGFLLLTFALQHNGVARAANFQKILGFACMLPLLLVGIVPLITGDLPRENLFPLLPIVRDAAGGIGFGAWDAAGLTLLAGAMLGQVGLPTGLKPQFVTRANSVIRQRTQPARFLPLAFCAWRSSRWCRSLFRRLLGWRGCWILLFMMGLALRMPWQR